MKFLCKIGLHNYGKWSEPERKKNAVAGFSAVRALVQRRTCKSCGLVDERIVSRFVYDVDEMAG